MLSVAALVMATAFGDVFEGLEYFTSGEVEPGVWNTQYDKCVEKALTENVPLVVMSGRRPLRFRTRATSRTATRSSVSSP